MLNRLHHRIGRLEAGSRAQRVIAVKVGSADRDDAEIVPAALAEAGISRQPDDLLVKLLHFSPVHLVPPASVVAVHPRRVGR